MIEKKEFFSNSLKEVISIAAEDLEVEEKDLRYEIVTGKTKYFGHKKREIYINAWAAKKTEGTISNFIENLIDEMEIDLSFEFEEQEEFLRVNYSGDDYRLLLYQNGNLLNAFQYLLNRLFSEAIGKKIYCECESFRKNREKELISITNRHAKEIENSGKLIQMKELNPFERRIVHMTVNKFSDLQSESEGDNFLKVITISRK